MRRARKVVAHDHDPSCTRNSAYTFTDRREHMIRWGRGDSHSIFLALYLMKTTSSEKSSLLPWVAWQGRCLRR